MCCHSENSWTTELASGGWTHKTCSFLVGIHFGRLLIDVIDFSYDSTTHKIFLKLYFTESQYASHMSHDTHHSYNPFLATLLLGCVSILHSSCDPMF
jgi:hypothetical protein